VRRSCSPGATTAPDSTRPNTSSYDARNSRSCGRMSGLTSARGVSLTLIVLRNPDRLHPVDPATAGPAVKLLALGSSPRAHRALVGLGLWARTECRASQNTLRLLGRENRLGLLSHPQPLAELCDETRHRASLCRFAEMFVPRAGNILAPVRLSRVDQTHRARTTRPIAST
jgi:hypothetical protein